MEQNENKKLGTTKKRSKKTQEKIQFYNYETSKIVTFANAKGHNKITTRDLNGRVTNPTFTLNTKDEIMNFIKNPASYENELREAIKYIYGASSHFRRLIQYFVSLTDLSYILTPIGFDPIKTNGKTIQNQYRKTIKLVESMNLKNQCPDILAKCLREDVAYLTTWQTDCNIYFQHLDPRYCKIATIEDGVFNVTFDFSYFDTNAEMIEFFPKEFDKKYRQYLGDRMNRWIELDAPTSFAIKCTRDIPEYPLPPFAGILRDLFDIEDYKQLKLTKTALENYSMLAMQLPMDSDGSFLIDFDRANRFYQNLDSVLPEEVGSVLSPMKIEQFDFKKSNTADVNNVTDSEQQLFTAAGVSSLLFNNPKASANALTLSIKVDQQLTYGIVKSIEEAVNRILHYESYSSKFRFTFLDVSPFNRKEMGDQYLKAAQYGLSTIAAYAASQGLSQLEMDTMSWLENDVLNLKERLIPLQSSNTQSGNSSTSNKESKGATDEGGRPEADIEELSDNGEISRENEANDQ